jgi:phosphatidylglycerol:prolipoprotein diacylglycerol transferase
MLGMIPDTATASLPIHPTPIYEIIFNLALFAYFWTKRDSFKVRGSMFRLYLVLYGGFRLLEEFVRGDSPMPEVGFMKPVQWLLLIAVLYFTRVFYNNEFKSKAAS